MMDSGFGYQPYGGYSMAGKKARAVRVVRSGGWKVGLSGSIEVPTFNGQLSVSVSEGVSIVFVGANGAGKTRLGVLIDNVLSHQGLEVHRIAAHRSLSLNPAVVPPSFEVATNLLFYGYASGSYQHKPGHRFQSKPETAMLSDFDHLLAALYADNNDVSIKFRQNALNSPGIAIDPPPARLDKLKEIWSIVLPHRDLIILGGNIKTRTHDGQEYSASDMSDGERVIFYLIGQSLISKPNTLLIFDEPELHINRSIIAKLWDEIESARPDCCFLYITHDVEFAGSRHAATKYALRSYRRVPSEAWDIELVPEAGDIPDDVVATIVGSRRPILFVEGDGGSLDSSLYRRVYNQFTVIPVGSCEQVIHTVAAFAARPQLHRVGCAGLVDADGRTHAEATYLAARGVYRLPVSEVENLLLLPNVFLALAAALNFSETEAQAKLSTLRLTVLRLALEQIDEICLRYTKRRVDAEMKKIGLAGTDIAALDAAFSQAAGSVSPSSIFQAAKIELASAVQSQNYEKVLLHFDNKGLLAEAGRQLGYQQKPLEEFIGRALRSDDNSDLHAALAQYLPTVTPRP
ncbi:MAG: AAA family ATPase [Bosea sp. (in: a-proteobacteria)]|nr:AAA family ATPase [Bosea sp. (in: a-proteobacteria)]